MRKKFAKKLSLEGEYFDNLQDLVQKAMSYAKDAQVVDGNYYPAQLAKSFCELQDEKHKEKS